MHPKTDFRPSNRWWNPNANRAKGGFQWQNHDPKTFKSIQKHPKASKNSKVWGHESTWPSISLLFWSLRDTKSHYWIYWSVTSMLSNGTAGLKIDRHRIPSPVDLSLMLKIRILHAPWFVASCWEMFHLVKSWKNFNGIQWNVGHRHHGNAVYEKRTQNNRVWIVLALSEAWFHGEIIR